MKRISVLLTNLISRSKTIDEKEKLIYEYCIRIILKRCLFVILLLFFGILTNRVCVSLLFLLTFIPLRSFCGGMHASTPTICTVLSYGIGLAIIFFSPLLGELIPYPVILYFFILFCIPIILFAPVDTKNKRFNLTQISSLRIKCLFLTLLIGVVFIFLSLVHAQTYCMTLSLCVIICSVSIVIGSLQNRRNRDEA